jgi:hypothetical protein
VFGDNTLHRGKKGAAILSDEPNTYGFITKKFPRGDNDAFYRPAEYEYVYKAEMEKLVKVIQDNPGKVYMISQLGAGLANRFKIFEKVIEPSVKKTLGKFSNVVFLW